MQYIDLFAGLGGVTSAMVKFGMTGVSVEVNPKEYGTSRKYQRSHHLNFPNSKFVLDTVQSWQKQGYPNSPKDTFILHGSLPCQSFSEANKGKDKGESELDIELAVCMAKTILEKAPKYWTLEQVPSFAKSESWAIAKKLLTPYYHGVGQIIKLKDYGIPQDRVRLFGMYSLKNLPLLQLPPKQPTTGWGSCGDFPTGSLLLHPYKKKDLNLARTTDRPFNTILRSHFTDGANYRPRVYRYLHEGIEYDIPMAAIAKAQGFFDDFILPSMPRVAGAGLGNAFCPKFYLAFLEENFSPHES